MSENESQNQSRAFWDVCVDVMVKKKKKKKYSYCSHTRDLDESVFGIEVTEDKAPLYKTTLGSALKLSSTTKATTKAPTG